MTKNPRRYGVLYFCSVQDKTDADTWGSTNFLENACSNASRHVGKSDFKTISGTARESGYRKALIYDKQAERVVRVYKRDKTGIRIIDLEAGETSGHSIDSE